MSGSTVLHEVSKMEAPNLAFRLRKTLAALEDSWKASIRAERFRCWPDWSQEGVRLGLGTLLTKRIVGDEARLLSLLSFVFERSFAVSVLNDLKKIEAMRLTGALSKSDVPLTPAAIPPLLALDSARRLHIAAGLMDAGFLQPLELLELAGLDPVHLRSLEKYSPDQPRVPAGQTGGGQWTDTAGADRTPLDNKVALAGVLVGRTVDHKKEITHCWYSTPFGTFTIEYLFVTQCDPTFPVPF